MNQPTYPSVPSQPDLPAIERDVLDRWRRDDTFKLSIEQRDAGDDGTNEFVFYDGPPFANGLPHYGHLLTGYVKDAVPRFQTMRGRRVERRFGWDCHGLPAEVHVEKELGISGHPEIIEFGIDKFNDACRTSVLRYTQEWEDYVTRQARWVDFDNDYKTLDTDYMESVMWAFKSLWDKGLVYEDDRVLWYCWHCETPLSNTETKMDDTYRQRQDPAVTVGLVLDAPDTDLDGVRALVWTTTPWTLPSNLAAAVHPDVEYVVVESDQHPGERFLLAAERVESYTRELGDEPTVVGTYRGGELVGTSYQPPFPFFVGREHAHQVLSADYVTTDDGTGMVHIAPAFGEEDKLVTDAAGIAVVNPVDQGGRFTSEVGPYAGQHVFEANKAIIADLKAADLLLRHETYDHSYPHCWRCDSPLIQRAVSSWFVQVTQFKDRMLELNQQITWVPEHIKDGQFGKWLENARDWNISRNRFWGSPIPVWRSDDPEYPRLDVYGSIAELEADFGVAVTDLHRPAIDELTRPNPDDPTGRSTMRRVTEVLDCWFESGSMPFAQVHYPFENAEWFDDHYPGDFIVEYIGQTRGWFYTMHVLATALFDRPAFSNCLSHGIVLGDDGRKMSKSLSNYPDPNEMFDVYGADAMRWYLLSSPVLRGADFSVTEAGLRDTVRHVILPLWNAYYFLTLYANAAGVHGNVRTDQTDVLDRYLLGELRVLVSGVTERMDVFDLFGACEHVATFLDTLTNWYIRRSRDRFWSGDQDAIDTLHTALATLCQVAAPLLPLVTDHIADGLSGGSSVHLADWPDADQFPHDDNLHAGMAQVRDACSTLLSLRKAEGLRVRLPLAGAVVAAPDVDLVAPHIDILRDELNVKDVELTTEVDRFGRRELVLNPKALGPRLGPRMQEVVKAHKAGDWSVDGDHAVVGGVDLLEGEFDFRLVSGEDAGAMATLRHSDGLVVLDTEVTPALEREGAARDLIRQVQQARREAGLDVSDRIVLTVAGPPEVVSAFDAHQELVQRETLSVEATVMPADELDVTVRRV